MGGQKRCDRTLARSSFWICRIKQLFGNGAHPLPFSACKGLLRCILSANTLLIWKRRTCFLKMSFGARVELGLSSPPACGATRVSTLTIKHGLTVEIDAVP